MPLVPADGAGEAGITSYNVCYTKLLRHPQQEFLKVDTTNILFICGGAFAGLEEIIMRRTVSKNMGFGAEIKQKKEQHLGETLSQVEPVDLLKYGLILV